MTGGFPNTRFGWGMEEEGYHKGKHGLSVDGSRFRPLEYILGSSKQSDGRPKMAAPESV